MYCDECKYFRPIISQKGSYYCYHNKKYYDFPQRICESFEKTIKSLEEKEEKIW